MQMSGSLVGRVKKDVQKVSRKFDLLQNQFNIDARTFNMWTDENESHQFISYK